MYKILKVILYLPFEANNVKEIFRMSNKSKI